MKATIEIMDTFRKLFVIRMDAYGTRALNRDVVWQVKSPLTDAILLAHLCGVTPVGAHSIAPDGNTKWWTRTIFLRTTIRQFDSSTVRHRKHILYRAKQRRIAYLWRTKITTLNYEVDEYTRREITYYGFQ